MNPKGFDGRYSFSGEGIERVYGYLKGNQNRQERHNQHLRRSIEKYGFDAFEVDKVFDVALTREELNEKEAYYVEKYDSFKHGYNQTYGGDNYPRGEYCKNSKRVCQISLDGELIKVWNSATEAHEETGACVSAISHICAAESGKPSRPIKTSGGYVWVFEKDYDPNKDYSRTPQKKDQGRGTKPVLLLDDDKNILQEFYSVHNAAEALNACPQRVSDICRHRIKKPQYNLVFKSEYLEEQRLNEKGSYEDAS